ncbi:hypothetical protein C4D60_Mb01t20450 [Musa balbisiana]|uniref:GPN-loop GTPase 3 n=1 Tax=Musa balbisiana TaxID=52838 RepID=A0A4S8JQB5_MUSBA|nr:hypothetical protein C4D60_Mb01t20450 [Musa balbisiana]
MGYAHLVIGHAGIRKSTYCSSLYQHCETTRRTVHIVNLDPAAEHFDYPVAVDIRELICLDDRMEELGLGQNGGLIYCMDMVNFIVYTTRLEKESSIQYVLSCINNCIQFGEDDADVKIKNFDPVEDE